MGTLNTFSPKQQGYGTFFSYSTSFVATMSNYEILPSVSEKSYYLTDIVLCPGSAAGSFTFTEAPTGTSNNVIDEVYIAASTMQSVGFKTPIVTTAGASIRISVEKNGTSTRTIIISGYKL